MGLWDDEFRHIIHYPHRSQGLSAEENMIFQLIRASENEGNGQSYRNYSTPLTGLGIWTKHLKSKTNLHKPVIERCLRSLIAKKFIKRVSSVQVSMNVASNSSEMLRW